MWVAVNGLERYPNFSCCGADGNAGRHRTGIVSHPTIGGRVRALEDATGQTLFQRTADGFVLTEEGSHIV
jgi:hypothetical protein